MLGSLQGLQPNNQQGQGQQQQQGPQGGGIPPPPPQNGQDYTLSSVLHFLQTEWRRYERDRNEWEIERAEMRARIALLEGERRSFENVKLDLMRRIKMLEYALRMERSKQLAAPSAAAKIGAPTTIKEESKEDSTGSGNGSPRSDDSPLPDSRLPNGPQQHGRQSTVSGSIFPNTSNMNALGKPPPGRDPKSRARSRDYLKQCLQEISYLTSPQAMNPLPNRPLLNNSSMPLTLPNVPSFDQMPYNGRPRKILPENNNLLNGINLMSGPSSAPAGANGQINGLERPNPLGGLQGQPMSGPSGSPAIPQQQSPTTAPPAPAGEGNAPVSRDESEAEPRSLTAIFRPDADWKERLRQSHEASEQSRRESSDDMKDEETEAEDDDETAVEGDGGKQWKTKRTLRNHLGAVRALAFHPTELCLATGGDDCTVKIWRMDVAGLTSPSARATTEVEPQLTLRGHSAAITKLIHSPSKRLIYSASLDSSIRVWSLPSPSHTTYAPYDEASQRGELIGHTDAVWDLALVHDETTLISCGAEGTVKVWDVSGPHGPGHLKLTWGFNGLESGAEHEDESAPGATAVEAIKVDLKKVAVAYQNAVVKIFDIETGKELSRLASDTTYDGTPATQVNKIASHPTMPLLVTAHEDKSFRIFDIETGACTHTMPAHLDGITSLAIDPAGFSLVTASHDCSIRVWDLLGSKTCSFEMTTHREKAREGVLDVEFHPYLPFLASAGADGVVKLYTSS